MAKIKIIEMGLRDGLQNEPKDISQTELFSLTKRLFQCGYEHIEAGALVSPKWVPKMAGSKELIRKILRAQSKGQLNPKTHISALAPNLRGLQDAEVLGLKDIAVFGSASEGFSQKNINCSIKESLHRFGQVAKEAKKKKIKVRGYISMAFACPYNGVTPPKRVAKLIDTYFDMGLYEVALGDTIGAASPKQVRAVLKLLDPKVKKKLVMHFHNTHGTAMANILESLEHDIHIFDASIGGLGGCPYAPGAAGNVATEDVVYMLESMGLKTGLDYEEIIKTAQWVQNKLGLKVTSKNSQTGVKKYFFK